MLYGFLDGIYLNLGKMKKTLYKHKNNHSSNLLFSTHNNRFSAFL